MVFVKEPLRNEPGYENEPQYYIDSYTNYIHYSTMRVGVLKMLKRPLPDFKHFDHIIKKHFIDH